MAKLTPKENFTKMINGEIPQSVPIYTMGMYFPGSPTRPPTHSIGPYLGGMGEMMERMARGEGFNPPAAGAKRVDEWGVTWVGNPEGNGGQVPEPGNFILKDICDWKKIIKKPEPIDVSDSFWREKAEKDNKLSGIDRTQSLAAVGGMFSPFQSLVGFMGFTEGLMAMYEEPEEVKELLNWQCDYYVPALEKVAQYYNADLVSLADDSATKYNPFFSVEMYKEIFKPIYHRLVKPFTDRGLYAEFHNCGRCEDFVPDMVDFGVKGWDPAQTENDLLEIKKRGDISLIGCYDFVPPPDGVVTEELIRESARASFKKYAPGGHYAFAGGLLSQPNDPGSAQWNMWLQMEVAQLADCWYEKN
ncbi:MAG: veratrol--corrinoid protein metyltransferase [Spirochaetaceae bacterium]|jgi:hypothetical protein|nr:veratrol--corrinoid protein metyltransferase [Spirochaetaceae bacterium]